MSFRTYKLKVKAKTWKRDSYGLFDYETTSYNNQDITLTREGRLVRVNHQISYISPSSSPEKPSQRAQTGLGLEDTLLKVVESPEGIKVFCESFDEEDTNQLWTVIDRGDTSRGYALKVNDVIKLGRIKFKVTQIKVINEAEAKKKNRRSIIDSIRDHMQVAQDPLLSKELEDERAARGSIAANLCKICLYDKSDEENDPLISPCKCIGSVKYVHLKCIQNWVKSKLNMQQSKNIITILWKNLNCELCKEKLPITFTHQGEDYTLIPFDNRITGSYVMMESFSKEKDSTGIHLIDLSSNQNFKIGRGHDCDLKIADISVSRLHAMLVTSKGSLYLKDNNSKFGTLVLKKGPLVLNSANMTSTWFQCGRTLIKLRLKKPWLAFVPCLSTFFAPHQEIQQTANIDLQASNEGGGDDTMVRFTSEEDLKKERRLSVCFYYI